MADDELTLKAVHLTHPAQELADTVGRLVLSPSRAAFEVRGKDPMVLAKAQEIERLDWTETGSRAALTLVLAGGKDANGDVAMNENEHGEDEAPVVGPPRVFRLTNIARSDKDAVQKFASTHWALSLSPLSWDPRGLNCGSARVDRHARTLVLTSAVSDDKNQPAMEFPLSGVTQVNKGNHEIEVTYAPKRVGAPAGRGGGVQETDNDTGKFELVVARFAVPPNEEEQDVTDMLAARISAAASITDDVGEELLCEIPEEQGNFVVPRGKFRIEMYAETCRMRGKGKDIRFKFSDINQIFLLEHPETDHKFVVFALDKPARQGNQRYAHLVMQLENKESVVSLLNMTKDEIPRKFPHSDIAATLDVDIAGVLPDIIARAFKLFSGKKVFVASDKFTSHDGKRGVRCTHKTQPGYLYPMKRQMLFVPHKTLLLMRYDDVEQLSAIPPNSSSKTWEFTVKMKPSAREPGGSTAQFQTVSRDEFSPLMRFFLETDVKILNKSKMQQEVTRAGSGKSSRRAAAAAADSIAQELGSDADSDDEEEDSDFDENAKEGSASGSASGSGSGSDSDGSDDDDDDDDDGEGSDMAELVSEGEDGDDDDASDGGGGEDGEGKRAKKSKREKKMGKDAGGDVADEGSSRRARDPNAPKRPQSAYAFFMQSWHAENKGLGGIKDTTAKMSEAWRSISSEERAKLDEMVARDKERFEREMEAYEPSEGFGKDGYALSSGGKKKRGEKVKGGPKKGLSAYMFFVAEKRKSPEFQGLGVTDVAKKAGEIWKTISEEDKKPFEELAAKDKARYEEELKAFKAAGGDVAATTSGTAAKKKRSPAAAASGDAKKARAGGAGKGKAKGRKGKGASAAGFGDSDSSSDSSSDDDDAGDAGDAMEVE